MNNVLHETDSFKRPALRLLSIADLFTRYVHVAPVNPADLIKIRITRPSDGTSSEVTLADLMRNMRVTYEEHAAILRGEAVTFGDDTATAITAEMVQDAALAALSATPR